jgi:UTP-glucose-1-phosphate uridylyltransferase/mevalonate kinase
MRLFIPGRICLFGEHSDWAGGHRRVNPSILPGYTLICGTDQGIHAEVRPHPNALVLTATTPEGAVHGPHQLPMERQALLTEARRGGFWSYVAGVAYQALTHYRVQGLVIDNFRTDLPIKKGLSSSAAICVLAARAFNRLYELKLTIRGEMELAYQGEITTPSRCGRMDQGCAFGHRAVLMTFDGDHLDTAQIPVGGDLHFVIVDLQAEKDTMKILARLNRCYPNAGDEIARGVQELLGPINRRIVHQAVEALRTGDAGQIGALMVEAQGHFDRLATPACPEELTAPVLHRLLSYEPLQPHIWGGKGVGSQGDGAAQLVARSCADQRAVIEIVEGDLGMSCLALTLLAGNPDQPPAPRPQTHHSATIAHARPRVRKAVITAAGLGTRLFPATRATKKELFPIVDRDGVAKPAILLIVEEAVEAGLEEVIVVVQEQDLASFQSLFAGPLPDSSYDKLPTHLQSYTRRLEELGRRVSFAVQPTQEGFGHAVYRARERVGDEPFLLMLGDHLYHTTNTRSCTRQLLQVYHQHGISVLGLRRTPESAVGRYGTVTGQWLEENRLLRATELAEKPSVDYARANLRMPGLPEGEYLTLFGLYLLKPQVFDCLQEQIAGNQRERGEFQLSTALERLRREEGFLGLVVDGQSYDIGLPDSYLHALQRLRQGGG